MTDERDMPDGTEGAPTQPGSPAHPGLLRTLAHRLAGDPAVLPIEGRMAPFERATGWLNSEPLTPEGLRGRVVLVDFWTYTCVNWIRTLPYLRAWATKYADVGLTIVGVHTPEFGFERDLDNIVMRTRDFGVEYPVAIDSDYGVWQAFANHFWPAIYLADADGRIRYHHFGEGEYAMTEMAIQQLIAADGAPTVDPDLVDVHPVGLEVAADWRSVRSPETYVGFGQASGFAQGDVARLDAAAVYATPPHLRLNQWGLAGTWTVARHASIANEPGGRIAFRFHARDVNLVMGPATPGTSVPFRVLLDGEPVADSHGTDVADGTGVVSAQRTYQLVRQSGSIIERTFELEFLDAGVEVYCFTFG
jgi:thiol-disulfide isomerase/thioredoxin